MYKNSKKTIPHARLELATPALLTHTAYKYRALTNYANGDRYISKGRTMILVIIETSVGTIQKLFFKYNNNFI